MYCAGDLENDVNQNKQEQEQEQEYFYVVFFSRLLLQVIPLKEAEVRVVLIIGVTGTRKVYKPRNYSSLFPSECTSSSNGLINQSCDG